MVYVDIANSETGLSARGKINEIGSDVEKSVRQVSDIANVSSELEYWGNGTSVLDLSDKKYYKWSGSAWERDYRAATTIDSGVGATEFVWDDLRISPTTLPSIGARSPEHKVVANDGTSSSTSNAIVLDGNNDYTTVGDYPALDVTEMTIEGWYKPVSSGSYELLDRDSNFEFYMSGGQLQFTLKGVNNDSQSSDNGVILAGGYQHYAVVISDEGARRRATFYVDGVEKGSGRLNANFTGASDGLRFGQYTSGWNYQGSMDNCIIYNVPLTLSQIQERYNGGDGSITLPTGVTEATDVVARFEYDEGTGTVVDNNCTLGSGSDMMLFNSIGWEAGHVDSGNPTGSFGVVALSFNADTTNEIFFSAQMPHTYAEGTSIFPHIHWMNPSPGSGNIVFGLEYLWVNKEEAIAGGNTTVVKKVIAAGTQGVHNINTIAELDGTGKKISSILECRLFRDGSNSSDTLASEMFLSEFDFHFKIDSLGSYQEYIKRL